MIGHEASVMAKKIDSTNYWDTRVPVSKSQQDIRDMLEKFGAEGFSFSESFKGDGRAAISFVYKGLPAQMQVDPTKVASLYLQKNPWNYRKKKSRTEYEKWAVQKSKPVAFRVLYHALKAMLIAVEYGVQEFEEVFLAHFVLDAKGKNPRSLGHEYIPKLAELIEGKLLLGDGS
jgi:hypothetical protein